MTKTDLIFPAFPLRFVDFAVQFCFPCKFFLSSPKWAKAGFRVMLKYFEINKSFMCDNLFRYYIKQNLVRTSVTHSAIASCVTFLFLPHFDVICDLLLNRRTATWNLFVK